MTQPPGRFHRCTLLCPRVTLPGSASSVSVRCRFHTAGRVPGVLQDGGDRAQVQLAPVRCVLRPGPGPAADGEISTPASFKRPRDPRHRMPGEALGEDPPHHGCRPAGRVPAGAPAVPHAACALSGCGPASPSRYPYGGRPPRYRPCSLAWDGHRGPDRDAGPGDLPLGRQPEHGHRLLIMLRPVVDPAAGLGHPQLHAVMLEQRRHCRVLAAVKGSLCTPRSRPASPPPVRIGELGDQRGGLRAAGPRHRPGLPRHRTAPPRSPRGPARGPQPAPAAAPATSPDPANPRSTPARRTETAPCRARPGAGPSGRSAPPTTPGRPRLSPARGQGQTAQHHPSAPPVPRGNVP